MTKEQVAIEIAKTIAWHHCDRKQQLGSPRGPEGKRQRNDSYSEREYKTFLPAAIAVLNQIESWGSEVDE